MPELSRGHHLDNVRTSGLGGHATQLHSKVTPTAFVMALPIPTDSRNQQVRSLISAKRLPVAVLSPKAPVESGNGCPQKFVSGSPMTSTQMLDERAAKRLGSRLMPVGYAPCTSGGRETSCVQSARSSGALGRQMPRPGSRFRSSCTNAVLVGPRAGDRRDDAC